MTFEKLLNEISSGDISHDDAVAEMMTKKHLKKINFYVHYNDISNNMDPLSNSQLQELQSIVEILQILDDSELVKVINDAMYDNMQELLIDMGIPRISGTVDISDNSKQNHRFTKLRGTLDKVYYLYPDEKRTNKSRKYLDEWIKKTESLYKKNTGKDISLNRVKIMCQPKFDGTSVIMETGPKPLWLTRGDTDNNLASDVSHIMDIFNDIYNDPGKYGGIKFEVMMTENNKEKINELIRDSSKKYHNSRQIVTSILNSVEPDWKSEYLYPVPLRIINGNDEVEQIAPQLIDKFPTMICTFGDRDRIKQFANENRYVNIDGMRFRTDGVVMTILDDNIKIALGRDRNINNFEIAYKFTEEAAYSRVNSCEFYVSNFGYITPVLVINDVIMKGNTINHISLSNKERFDELNLSYGDEVKVLYDIIPYVTIDEKCTRVKNGRKIEFIKECPKCYQDLDLDRVQVRCDNPRCPSKLVGRVLNYCNNLRIKNIGYQTLDMLFQVGLLNDGIKSLYKFKKKSELIEDLDGFGKLKTKKIISEIEAKRKLKDYQFFGSLGIDKLSMDTFQIIFNEIKLSEFLDMIRLKNFDLLNAKLVDIDGIGNIKAKILIDYFKEQTSRKELDKLLKEVTLYESYGNKSNKRIVFTGCRPTDEMISNLGKQGYDATDKWSASSTKYLIVPNEDYESSKVKDARKLNIPILTKDELIKKFNI